MQLICKNKLCCLEFFFSNWQTYTAFGHCCQFSLFAIALLWFADAPIRFTSVRVTAKYHGIKLDYRELRHTVLDLLGQIKAKLRVWGRAFISPEAVRMLLQEWHVSSDSTTRYIVTTDTRT